MIMNILNCNSNLHIDDEFTSQMMRHCFPDTKVDQLLFESKNYRCWQYWSCIYLVSDLYQNVAVSHSPSCLFLLLVACSKVLLLCSLNGRYALKAKKIPQRAATVLHMDHVKVSICLTAQNDLIQSMSATSAFYCTVYITL